MPQSRLESIDRFTGGLTFDLGPHQPAVDVQVGLRDHRARHRRVGMPGQSDPGVKHGQVRESTEPADFFLYVIFDTG